MNMMDWVGQTLGKYRIEAPLDAGGMGQVFRGMHTYLNRPAAIKVMRVNLADNPNFRARFLQEARSAAALKHPNIVEIYDFGDQDGNLYLVMELMTDGSLGTLLRRRAGGQPWPLSLGLDLARQAAEGLAEAHTHEMVHRDIKPDNLLLNRRKRAGQQPESEQYQLKISDFGLARMAAGSGLTVTGAPMGTLAYMSPEQCRGGQLDGRSDLYALGIVLYQIATGLLPFQISTFEEALQKHANVAPLPPRQVRSDVPPLLEEIILRCMAKQPQERYATGTELARALRNVLGDERLETVAPISLPPPPSADKTGLQPPVSGMTPAPIVSTLPGGSTLPRVRVLDQNGQTLRVAEVTGYGLRVGRDGDNDIVLQGQAVSRQHLRVTWDGRQVSVTDLGSSNGTLLGDVRLLPQVSQVWMPRQVIRVGSFWLRLEGPASRGISSMPDSPSQTQLRGGSVSQTQLRGTFSQPTSNQRAASLAGSGRIGVLAEPAALTITPGQPAITQITLVNLGSIVDWFTITVEGVAQEWISGPRQEVQLNPNMEQTVVLNVNVGRAANNHAGDYPVTIRARSREKPEESGIAQAHWTVLPFREDELRIEPRRVSGRGKANYAVTLHNGGNIATGFSLSGDDDEKKLVYRFGKNEVALEQGKDEKVPLTVEARRHWLGREQRKPFQVHARPAGNSIPMTTQGELVNKALLPGWVIPVLLIAAIGVSLIVGSSLGLLHGGSTLPTPTPGGPAVQLPTSAPTLDTQATADVQGTANAQATANANGTAISNTQANATATANAQANATATANASLREINNDDPGISYTGSCYYNHGLSSLLYNDDVEICKQQNDSFTYTFTGTSIYLVTMYYQNHGGTISCYIDGSLTQSYNLDSSDGVDNYGLRYGVVLPIAPQLTFSQHTASCTMTSASGTYFFVDALIINK